MCGSRAVWEPSHGEYLCEGLLPPSESYAYSQPCPWSGTPDEIDDGRIRGPEDVAMRMAGALERISTDGRVSELDRATHSTYVDVVLENTSVEIMAADGWVAEQVSTELGRKIPRQHVARSRAKLEGLGYVRRLGVSDITRHGLRAAVKTRQVAGMRVPTLLEVRKAPPMPECEVCGADIPDGLRVLKRYCSTRCRVAAHRARDEVLAAAM
jgi:predicted nucleic acid-binding Zn ribbon protein